MNPEEKPAIALISYHADPTAELGMEAAGGQNIYVRKIGEALAEKGWSVDLLTRKVSSEQSDIINHRSGCQTIRLIAGPQEFIPQDDLFPSLGEFVQRVLDLQKETGRFYSLIHTNYWLEAWIGMELKKYQSFKQIHTNHSLGVVKYNAIPPEDIPPIANTRLEVEKACLESLERVVATSPQEKEILQSLVPTSTNIEMIPCGTDVKHFGSISQQEARQKLGLAADLKVVLYVGRFESRKGIEILVRAVAKSKTRQSENLKLIIVAGSRPGRDEKERQHIVNLVQELGIEDITTFAGRIPQQALPPFYAAANVCVVPSYYEPFGLVAIEAMASGTPVVASDVGGLQFTVIPEITGLLVPPKNPIALAEALDRILGNPLWASQLGKAGRKRVEEKFSWEYVVEELSRLYQHLLTD